MKYYFVSVIGLKLIDAEGKLGNLEDTDVPGIIEKNGKKYLQVEGHYSSTIVSNNGFFVPSMIQDYLENELSLEQCIITFVREMSEEEYEADKKYKVTSKLPKPLEKGLLDEIDDLVGRAETGDLRVYKPTTPDVPETKEKKDLRDLGLPDNLFDDPYGDN